MRREQLTLFVTGTPAGPIERVRREMDPVQASLIAAHVTLCRGDEIADAGADAIVARLARDPGASLELVFGDPVAFDGHGVLLPCTRGEEAFHALRAHVLGRADARRAAAHVTLAHPRNPRAAGNAIERAAALPLPLRIRFTEVARIEQLDGGPWSALGRWPLR